MMFLILCFVSYLPEESYIQRVDKVEYNNYYDEKGKEIFDQLIFYEWSEEDFRFNVVAWRLVKGNTVFHIQQNENNYVLYLIDQDKLRKIVFLTFVETWTQIDPELENRKFLPKEQRKELFKSRRSR